MEDLAADQTDYHVEEGGVASVILLRADEGGDVGPRLRDDEVVDVEELTDSFQWCFLEFGSAVAGAFSPLRGVGWVVGGDEGFGGACLVLTV